MASDEQELSRLKQTDSYRLFQYEKALKEIVNVTYSTVEGEMVRERIRQLALNVLPIS